MKIMMALMLLSFPLLAAQKEWVELGQNDVTQGYKTYYRLILQAPKGIHASKDIKDGSQVMRFQLTWLPPHMSEENVRSHFNDLLAAQFSDPEDLKFNQIIINRLLKKLPEANRHDQWYFEYSPDAGTKVIIGGTPVHNIIGSEANRALHQAWLHESPVVTAKLMKRLLKAEK